MKVMNDIINAKLNIASMAERLTRVLHLRKIWSLNSGPSKSYTVLQTVCHWFKRVLNPNFRPFSFELKKIRFK